MKILYAIQGTGNGHLSRANDIVPILQKKADLDILVSGCQSDLVLPFDIKYQLKGMSFIFGKNGGVDLWDTYKNTNTRRLWQEIRSLPANQYDLIINDFEMVSTWAARMQNVPIVSLSHQAAVLNKNSPQPKNSDWVGKRILKHYAPTKFNYGFHFEPYDENIFTPVIRKAVRQLDVTDNGHYTVYLPAYGDKQIIKKLANFKHIKWEVFSKHTKKSYRKKNVFIAPIQNNAFLESMASSAGILCGAGFETPAEALFLQKKLMVVPMKTQYEQQCNAAALKKMGVPVIKNLKAKRLAKIENWLNKNHKVTINYPDKTEDIIDTILQKHLPINDPITRLNHHVI